MFKLVHQIFSELELVLEHGEKLTSRARTEPVEATQAQTCSQITSEQQTYIYICIVEEVLIMHVRLLQEKASISK